jgi:hypothetical protein
MPKLISLTKTRNETMATRTVPAYYATAGFWLMVLGIVLIVVSAFGIDAPVVDLFKVGVGLCFASMLTR